MIERWQIYAVPLGTIKPGAIPTRVPFQLDNDAPFILRGRSIGITETTGTTSPLYVQQLWTRFTDAAETWNANQVIPSYVDIPGGGSGGNPAPVYPEKRYPAGSIIQSDIYNDGAADAVNGVTATLYLHGVKVYNDGAVYAPTYPQRCNPKPYSATMPTLADRLAGYLLSIGTTQSIQNWRLTVGGDGDYVFRAGTLGWNLIQDGDTYGFKNLTVVVKDNQQRAYMNAPCHVYHVFGIPGSQGTPTTANVLAGAFNPGLFCPELYVRANDNLFFDFARADTGLSLHTCQLQVVFSGSKVYFK